MHDTQKELKILAKSILTTSTVNMFVQVGRSRLSREGGERESRRHTYRKGKERKEETGLWKVTTETIIKG